MEGVAGVGSHVSKQKTVSPSQRPSVILQNQERSGLPNHIYPYGPLKCFVYLFPFPECFPQKSVPQFLR